MNYYEDVELSDTVEMMISDDYKERMRAEYLQVLIRFDKLSHILDKYEQNQLDFKPTDIDLLYEQYRVMQEYIDILRKRIKEEGVEVC